jgi:hypothetical protein
MTSPNRTSAVQLGGAVVKALGLEGKSVASLSLHFRGVRVEADVTLLVPSVDGEGGLVEQLQHFTLVPKDEGEERLG